MSNEKWFYPLQKEAEQMINDKYEIMGLCNWQDILKHRVHENWTCKRKVDNKLCLVTTVIHENGLVHLYENLLE